MLSLLLAATFLNGVNIDGLRSQRFEKCRTVKIDDRGDVHLDCPGYEVQAQAPAQAPAVAAASVAGEASAAAVARHYWLVSEESAGGAQYDLDVFVNSKWVRKLKAGDPQMVLEITRYLKPGPNKLLFAARKQLDGGRKSASAAAFLKITVGEGEAGGNTVVIDNPLVECKRTAAETDDVNEEFTVQAR